MNRVLVFDHPWILFGLAVFIPILLYNIFSSREKRIKRILPRILKLRLSSSRILFRIFLACMIIALAGPRWGFGRAEGEYHRAADIAIAVDVSRSMEIADTGAGLTRLEQGLKIIAETVAANPQMRFALALSRSRGIIAVPLTWDNGTVLNMLQAVDSSSLTGRGTNLESLIDAASDVFRDSSLTTKEILLVSDGEALSGSLKAALGRCVQNNIALTAIAVGSDEGDVLPGSDETFSRRDSGAMRMAAAQTGGVYIDGNRENAAELLIAHLKTLAPDSAKGSERKEPKARWLIFALLAIVTFGASRLSLVSLPERRLKIKKIKLAAFIIPLMMCGCSQIPGKLLIIRGNYYNSRRNYDRAISSYLKALEHTQAKAYAQYGLGSVYYAMGEEKASLSRFAEAQDLVEFPATTQQELCYRIHYNTGVALFSEGDFSGAADSFREALRVNGKKIEAKWNLELSLQALEREDRSGSSGNGDGGEIKAVLFEYIRQKELTQWQNMEWPEEETTGPDY